MRAFIDFLLSTKQKLVLFLTSQVILSSRILHNKKYAKLYIWIHDISGIHAIRFGSWEWYNIDNLRYLVKSRQIPSNTFLDIGSNIGFFSCNLSGYFDTILAFEPNPIAYHILKANLLLAEKHCSSKLSCFNFALGSNITPVNLDLMSGDNSAVSSFIQPTQSSESNINYTSSVINATSAVLDNILDLNSVSAIKIDVEGYELNVLNGLSKFFKSVKDLPFLAIEMLDLNSNPDITNLLLSFGYKYFYSYKRNNIYSMLGIRPVIFKLSPVELAASRRQLVYCSVYPLNL